MPEVTRYGSVSDGKALKDDTSLKKPIGEFTLITETSESVSHDSIVIDMSQKPLLMNHSRMKNTTSLSRPEQLSSSFFWSRISTPPPLYVAIISVLIFTVNSQILQSLGTDLHVSSLVSIFFCQKSKSVRSSKKGKSMADEDNKPETTEPIKLRLFSSDLLDALGLDMDTFAKSGAMDSLTKDEEDSHTSSKVRIVKGKKSTKKKGKSSGGRSSSTKKGRKQKDKIKKKGSTDNLADALADLLQKLPMTNKDTAVEVKDPIMLVPEDEEL